MSDIVKVADIGLESKFSGEFKSLIRQIEEHPFVEKISLGNINNGGKEKKEGIVSGKYLEEQRYMILTLYKDYYKQEMYVTLSPEDINLFKAFIIRIDKKYFGLK